MKRFLSILMLLLLVVPVTGCKSLRELMRRCADPICVTISRDEVSFTARCPFGTEPSSPVRESLYKAVTQLDRAVQRVAPTGGIDDECGPICTRFGPDSDECDQCRSIAGISIMNPTIAVCQGTSYAPLPPTIPWRLRAETDRGTQYSPDAYTFRKDPTRLSFDGCGGERAEYTIQDEGDRQALRSWASRLVDAGVRAVREVGYRWRAFPLSSGCLQPDADPLGCCVIVGGFLFDSEVSEPAHGIISECMLPYPDPDGDDYVFVGRGSFR